MLTMIANWDRQIFLLLNQKTINPFFDWCMPILSRQEYWYLPLALLTLLTILFSENKIRQTIVICTIFLTVGLTDYFCHIIKHLVARPRPFTMIPGAHVLMGANGYSFPSNHAANIFAGSIFLALLFKRWLAPLLFIALAVSFSRIYVGDHYPLDVFGGAFIGCCFAFLAALIFKRLNSKIERIIDERQKY